jgi:polyisoprenoid-binding protein YceI
MSWCDSSIREVCHERITDLFRSAKAPIFAVFALASLAAFAGQSSAGIYTFDNKRGDVSFTYYVGFVSQSGRFTDLNGVFQFDGRAPERGSINAVIKTASLTANAFEEELRSSRFFNVGVFPEIRFVSRSVRPVSENRAEFSGDLTMNGVTRPVTLQVIFQPEARTGFASANASSPDGRARVIATARLQRSAFNMTALSYLVNDEIEIQITAPLQEKK